MEDASRGARQPLVRRRRRLCGRADACAPYGFAYGESSLRNARVSSSHFVNVRLRPRRDRHCAGAQARKAEGEAVGTEKAEGKSLTKKIRVT